MTVYAVTYVYAADSSAVRDRFRPEHRDYLRALCSAGSVVTAGPLPATDDEPDGALIVVVAASAASAAALLDDDPFRREDVVAQVTVREWVPAIGALAA